MIDPSPLKTARESVMVDGHSRRGGPAGGRMWLVQLFLAAGFSATEGFRVIRRSPHAVLMWGLMWLVWFSVGIGVVATGQKVVLSDHVAQRTIWEIFRHYGPFAAALIALFFVVLGMTAIASFRAVLNPEQKRFFYLRLSADELRVAAISVMAFCLMAIFGGVPAGVLIALASPFMAAAPALARQIGDIGAFLTVCLDIWVCVRLSLIAVETFAEHRFHLSAYWPLVRGRFWYLLLCYVIIFLVLCVIMIAFFTISESLFRYALETLDPRNLFERVVLLGIAGLLAVLTSGYWLLTMILFCACQARAYLTITSATPSVRPPPWGAVPATRPAT